MNPKVVSGLKIALVVFIVMCAVILGSVNKITSTILLTITAIIVLLPIDASKKWLKWGRVVFVCVVFAMVAWNISTTDYPVGYYNTGFKFFDQVLHIFDGFLETVFGFRLNNSVPPHYQTPIDLRGN